MLDYIEKRDYIRMAMDCEATVNLEGIEPLTAVVKDLSANGVLVWTDTQIPSGCVGSLSIRPVKSITPPLSAEIEVIRSEPAEGQAGMYATACSIREIQKANVA